MTTPIIDGFRAAILREFPDFRDARFGLLTAGWDSVAVDADGRLICKFPRHKEAEKRLMKAP